VRNPSPRRGGILAQARMVLERECSLECFAQAKRYSRLGENGPGAKVFSGLFLLRQEIFRLSERDSRRSLNIFAQAKKNKREKENF